MIPYSIRDGRALSDEEIIGMLIGFLLAGQHTSSTTSAWMGFFLAKNKELQVCVGGFIGQYCPLLSSNSYFVHRGHGLYINYCAEISRLLLKHNNINHLLSV